jgi:hypothetical protein
MCNYGLRKCGGSCSIYSNKHILGTNILFYGKDS